MEHAVVRRAEKPSPYWTFLGILAPPVALVVASFLYWKPQRRLIAKDLALASAYTLAAMGAVIGLTALISALVG